MENYKLREDEVLLYKGDIEMSDKKDNTQLLLTNINIVFITKTKKIFQEESVDVISFPIEDIKMYEGVPQVKTKSNNVEIYLKSGEKEFAFDSKNELHKFVSAINKLLTGKSGTERNAEKVKKAIDLVNDTLGIDVLKCSTNVTKNNLVGSIIGSIGKIGNALFNKKKK